MAQDDKHKAAGGGAESGGFSRRGFLMLSAAAAAVSLLPMAAARAVAGAGGAVKNTDSVLPPQIDAPLDFRSLSQMLTGKEISPKLAERAWWAMANNQRRFPEKYEALRAYIAANGLKTIEDFKADSNLPPELRQTAMAVISAYYLGYAGTPLPLHAHDDTIFITFSEAKMYDANKDMAPVNTYSRWHSGYWAAGKS